MTELCSQWWSDDDGNLNCCTLERGHAGECFSTAPYSETVEEQ